tara:strand:+ start:922 stop:1131 length:210 start_codon:yes stop_codon:yes gene_type:complete
MIHAHASSFYHLWLNLRERIQSRIIEHVPPIIAPMELNVRNPVPIKINGIKIIHDRTFLQVRRFVGFST